jgi:acyl-CoA synthetase (NDP forming)
MTASASELPGARRVLAEVAARAFLETAGIPFARSILVRSEAELAGAVEQLGPDLVLKGAASWLVHKSDVGMVVAGVTAATAPAAFRGLVEAGQASGGLDGVLVQPRLEGVEMLVGLRRDPGLGPFVAVGAGGPLVEILDDVAVVTADAPTAAIRRALAGIRAAALLRGARGRPPVAVGALIRVVRAVGRLARVHPDVVELDLNPVFVSEAGAVAADARIVLGAAAAQERADTRDVAALFSPRSIAVVGASTEPGKLGSRLVRYLVAGGYPGAIYPVHPTADAIQGRRTVRSVRAIEPRPDLVCVLVPAAKVAAVVGECVDAGVPAVIVHAAGLAESGAAGRRIEARMVTRARAGATVICGPNSIGLMSPADGLYASFAGVLEAAPLPTGSIGFASHSGAIASSLISRAADLGFGFSRWVSTGNEADADMADFLSFLADDPATAIVVAYVESIRRGSAFREAAGRLRRAGKPLLVYAAGRSELGRTVIASHTGVVGSADRLMTAYLASLGAVRAPSLQAMLMAALVIDRQGLPSGPRTAVVTMSGAAATVCADAADAAGLPLASLGPTTRRRLRELIPLSGRPRNPVDVTASAMTDPEQLVAVLDLVAADPGVDQVLLQLTTNADPVAATMAEAIGRRTARTAGTGVPLIISRLGSPTLAPRAVATFRAAGLPVLTWPEDAVATALVVGNAGRMAIGYGRAARRG